MPRRDPARVAVELTNQVFVHIGVALLLLFLIRDLQFGYILDIARNGARNGQSGVPLGSATVLVMSRRREAVSASGLDYLACLRARTGVQTKKTVDATVDTHRTP